MVKKIVWILLTIWLVLVIAIFLTFPFALLYFSGPEQNEDFSINKPQSGPKQDGDSSTGEPQTSEAQPEGAGGKNQPLGNVTKPQQERIKPKNQTSVNTTESQAAETINQTPGNITEPQSEALNAKNQTSGNVTVHFIYVDIGDAIFIDTNGKDVLLDGGCGKCANEVLSYLAKINASADIIIASHHDEDHIGGLISLLNTLHEVKVWDSGSAKDTAIYQRYISVASTKNYSVVSRGQAYWLDNVTKLTITNPVHPLEFSQENDNSVAFKMEVGSVSFLFQGDCENDCENSILASGMNISANVLKAGHHCSRTSSSDAFLNEVNPKVAVCSVGAVGNEKYGHPHQETLNRFALRNINAYSTLNSGSIRITTDGKAFSVI